MNELYETTYEKILKLEWLMHKRRMMCRIKHGPMADRTRGQGRVLAVLKIQNEITTRNLAYILGVRQQSLNETLNRLEDKGYIVREPSEEDKRVMLVRLTEEGKQAAQESKAERGRFKMFAQLSEEELAAFGGCLEKMISALEEQIGADNIEELKNMESGGFAPFGHRHHPHHCLPPRPHHCPPPHFWKHGFERFLSDFHGFC